MAEQAIRTNKTEIGLKKGIFFYWGVNVVIVVLIVFQNKIREKVCNTRWIKSL